MDLSDDVSRVASPLETRSAMVTATARAAWNDRTAPAWGPVDCTTCPMSRSKAFASSAPRASAAYRRVAGHPPVAACHERLPSTCPTKQRRPPAAERDGIRAKSNAITNAALITCPAKQRRLLAARRDGIRWATDAITNTAPAGLSQHSLEP